MQKIMFNDRFGLTEAVLDGHKTMTRRIISPAVWKVYYRLASGKNLSVEKSLEYLFRLAPIKVGEVVAIAQSYETMWNARTVATQPMADWLYGNYYGTTPWTNKMYVKAEYMRHHIKITSVNVERLQDISDDDCLLEGVYMHDPVPYHSAFIGYTGDATLDEHKPKKWFRTPRDAFAALIDKVSGKGTWESNPTIFAYSFELID